MKMECIFCGATIPNELVHLKECGKMVPREMCKDCASPKAANRKSHRIRIPDCASRGAYRLAGEILKGCLERYRTLYISAYREIADLSGKTNGAVQEFLVYNSSLHHAYFDNLALGKMVALMAYVRRNESKGLIGGEKSAARMLEEMLIGAT